MGRVKDLEAFGMESKLVWIRVALNSLSYEGILAPGKGIHGDASTENECWAGAPDSTG